MYCQGCEGDIEGLMEDGMARLTDGVRFVCRLAGELALATDTPVMYCDRATTEKLTSNGQVGGVQQSSIKT